MKRLINLYEPYINKYFIEVVDVSPIFEPNKHPIKNYAQHKRDKLKRKKKKK